MKNGEVIGTQSPTGHDILIDARFELPYGKHGKKEHDNRAWRFGSEKPYKIKKNSEKNTKKIKK